MRGVVLALALVACAPARAPAPAPPLAMASEARPWAIWWWPGSAVDEAGLERHLDAYAWAGFGGVQVVPIYGARGVRAPRVPFLGPRWVALLRCTVRAAAARGMKVDVSTGT